jgi:uncharacterized membrane-anchored protein YitT (DUF2179 family)
MEENKTRKNWFVRSGQTILKELKREPPKKVAKNIGYMLLGSFLMALATEWFILPMNVIAGGSSALAMVLNAIPGLNKISPETYITIIYWVLFVVGLFTLGVRYSIKTLVVTITNPIFIKILGLIAENSILDNKPVFSMPYWAENGFYVGSHLISGPSAEATIFLLSALLGGVLTGIGIGVSMVGGGSSGGTDVLTLLLHKYLHLPLMVSGFIPDFLFILAGFFLVNQYNFPALLVGIVSAFLLSLTMDKVFAAFNSTYVALIASDKVREINDYITDTFSRGTTLLTCKGGYTKRDRELLEVCYDKNEYQPMMAAILSVDPNAFITTIEAREVVGYGFTRDTPEVELKDLALSPEEAKRFLSKKRKKEEKEEEKTEEKK